MITSRFLLYYGQFAAARERGRLEITKRRLTYMIEALRNDDIINKAGGRFKLTALIQRRWLQLLQGGRPMVDPKGLTEIEVVLKEIEQGKIEFILPADDEEDEE